MTCADREGGGGGERERVRESFHNAYEGTCRHDVRGGRERARAGERKRERECFHNECSGNMQARHASEVGLLAARPARYSFSFKYLLALLVQKYKL